MVDERFTRPVPEKGKTRKHPSTSSQHMKGFKLRHDARKLMLGKYLSDKQVP